jgi:hypothetical protein
MHSDNRIDIIRIRRIRQHSNLKMKKQRRLLNGKVNTTLKLVLSRTVNGVYGEL